jgi:hypothetical protein
MWCAHIRNKLFDFIIITIKKVKTMIKMRRIVRSQYLPYTYFIMIIYVPLFRNSTFIIAYYVVEKQNSSILFWHWHWKYRYYVLKVWVFF